MPDTKSKSQKASEAFENIAPLLGLGGSLAAQIPQLKKPKRIDSASRAARQASQAASAAAVGASQTGFGASRGLALRSGLRAAGNAARQGAAGGAQAASLDEQNYQTVKNVRNANVAKFGKDLGETTGMLATGITESRAAKQAEEEAAKAAELQTLQQQAAMLLPTYEQTAGDNALNEAALNGGLPAQNVQDPQALEQMPVGPGPGLDETDQFGNSMQDPYLPEPPGIDDISLDPIYNELGVADKESLYSIAPELELQHRMENFALDEAYRTGTNVQRIYARLRRLQNLPAINQTIDMNRQMQLQMPQLGGQ